MTKARIGKETAITPVSRDRGGLIIFVTPTKFTVRSDIVAWSCIRFGHSWSQKWHCQILQFCDSADF